MTETIKILQYNLHRSREITDSVLNHPDSEQFAIIAAQEQHNYLDTGTPLTHQSWILIQPSIQNGTPPRSAIYINKRHIPQARVTQIQIPIPDVTAISIGNRMHDKPTLVINIYNPKDAEIITALEQHLHDIPASDYDNIIILGDFNLHHPLWNPPGYDTQDHLAETLLELMTDLDLRPLLPRNTITRPSDNHAGGTTIDLVWGNENAEARVIKCQISSENDHGSDHLPIEIEINLQPDRQDDASRAPRYNLKQADWNTVNANLAQHLPALLNPNAATVDELDKYAADISDAILTSLEQTVPKMKPCPFSKRWWNDELTQLKRDVNRLRRVYQRTRNAMDRRAWTNKRNKYKREIKKAKKSTWQKFVTEANARTIWDLKKYMEGNTSYAMTPNIGNATSHDDKTAEFQHAFFPPPPPADISDIGQNAQHPAEVPYQSIITEHQLERVISKINPKKAPGPDGITNMVIQKTYDTTKAHILTMTQASFALAHFPKPYKMSTTVVLRKPNKPDYTRPNAYRPIALENTMGKILESIMAENLSYLTEEHQLLPEEHYGGRPNRTAEQALLMLTERIHEAWRKREIYSVILMDVAGAFNNVHHVRLTDNMKKRRIPSHIIQWIRSFLDDRQTQLSFDGNTSAPIPTPAGVPQGSPLSPILYMYYNADLLDVPEKCRIRNAQSLGFIDDIAYGVEGLTDEGNAERLGKMLDEAEVWRHKHGAQFEPTKYTLIHFSRNSRRSTIAPISLQETIIQPSGEGKYLGVTLDKELRFKQQRQQVARKGAKFAMAISRVCKASWGLQYKYARQLFTAVAVSRMDYGAIVWFRPPANGKPPGGISEIVTAQRAVMKATLGCFRTVPTAAMEIESALLPAHLRLQSKIIRAFIRFQSLPQTHPIARIISSAVQSRKGTFITTFEYLARSFPQYVKPMEEIHPYVRPPWWQPRHTIFLNDSRAEAKELHEVAPKNANALQVYTDGSGYKKHIGSAAYSATTQITLKEYAGSENNFTVYAGELNAITLAINIALTAPDMYTECAIYTDSKPAIIATTKPWRQSGQSIIREILDNIDNLMEVKGPEYKITITWIPSHAGIEANETVDAAAKEATEPMEEPRHKPLRSANMQLAKSNVMKAWKTSWSSATTKGSHLKRITSARHTAPIIKLSKVLKTRQQMSRLISMRTGHCSLNDYLHRFHIDHTDSPLCACGGGRRETVNHFLLDCTRYDQQRAQLASKVGIGGMWVEKLLGYPKLITHTLEYIENTKRMPF